MRWAPAYAGIDRNVAVHWSSHGIAALEYSAIKSVRRPFYLVLRLREHQSYSLAYQLLDNNISVGRSLLDRRHPFSTDYQSASSSAERRLPVAGSNEGLSD
jgi:hypothetical protein